MSLPPANYRHHGSIEQPADNGYPQQYIYPVNYFKEYRNLKRKLRLRKACADMKLEIPRDPTIKDLGKERGKEKKEPDPINYFEECQILKGNLRLLEKCAVKQPKLTRFPTEEDVERKRREEKKKSHETALVIVPPTTWTPRVIKSQEEFDEHLDALKVKLAELKCY